MSDVYRDTEKEYYSIIRGKINPTNETKSEHIVRMFYATVQNYVHNAVTGMVATKIILNRANSEKLNMGMRDNVSVTKKNATIAKNYLNDDELKRMQELDGLLLDTMITWSFSTMDDFKLLLTNFLTSNGYSSTINDIPSRRKANAYSKKEHEKYIEYYRIQ